MNTPSRVGVSLRRAEAHVVAWPRRGRRRPSAASLVDLSTHSTRPVRQRGVERAGLGSDVVHLLVGRLARHRGQPVQGALVDRAGHRDAALGLEAADRVDGRGVVGPGDVAEQPGDLPSRACRSRTRSPEAPRRGSSVRGARRCSSWSGVGSRSSPAAGARCARRPGRWPGARARPGSRGRRSAVARVVAARWSPRAARPAGTAGAGARAPARPGRRAQHDRRRGRAAPVDRRARGRRGSVAGETVGSGRRRPRLPPRWSTTERGVGAAAQRADDQRGRHQALEQSREQLHDVPPGKIEVSPVSRGRRRDRRIELPRIWSCPRAPPIRRAPRSPTLTPWPAQTSTSNPPTYAACSTRSPGATTSPTTCCRSARTGAGAAR